MKFKTVINSFNFVDLYLYLKISDRVKLYKTIVNINKNEI